MSARDAGHIENLSVKEEKLLKALWLVLISDCQGESGRAFREGMFLAIGVDHPSVVLLRWLRAKKWNVEEGRRQFLSTIAWREEMKIEELLRQGEELISPGELRSGKTRFVGFDRSSRPVSYVSVRCHVKGEYPLQSTERLTILLMETGRKFLRPPCESVTLIFDLTDFSLKNMDYQQLKFLIHLLENHYPESLALALVVNAPWLFNSCWSWIKGWLDPSVEKKIHFLQNREELNEFVDPSILPPHLQGSLSPFEYLPPTEEEQLIFDTLTHDRQGHETAKEQHQQAVEHFLQVTRRWAEGEEEEETNEEEVERREARERLSSTFVDLVPYIHRPTHYHRTGAIAEPSFQTTYLNIQRKKLSSSSLFNELQ